MSTHPNAILMLVLTPLDLSRKTMALIRQEMKATDCPDDTDITIEGKNYHTIIMETSYNEEFQISGKEGDLIFFNMATYGYGETISWSNLEAQKAALEAWAKNICQRHNCTHEIFITANYW